MHKALGEISLVYFLVYLKGPFLSMNFTPLKKRVGILRLFLKSGLEIMSMYRCKIFLTLKDGVKTSHLHMPHSLCMF
jgi:hypothetical protein